MGKREKARQKRVAASKSDGEQARRLAATPSLTPLDKRWRQRAKNAEKKLRLAAANADEPLPKRTRKLGAWRLGRSPGSS